MMYKLCSIVLVISVSANLGKEIPPLPVLHVDNSNNPTIQTLETPALTSAGISANLFEPLSSLCREWETVKFNDKEISDLKKIQRDEAFTIKTGDFKDHKLIPGKNSGSDRACPCHIQGKLCIPLCCLSDQMSSLDDGKLTCVNKTANPNLLRNFAKHLRDNEKLAPGKFVIVHRHEDHGTALNCAKNTSQLIPGIYKLDVKTGNLVLDDRVITPENYCFISEPQSFKPIYCGKSSNHANATILSSYKRNRTTQTQCINLERHYHGNSIDLIHTSLNVAGNTLQNHPVLNKTSSVDFENIFPTELTLTISLSNNKTYSADLMCNATEINESQSKNIISILDCHRTMVESKLGNSKSSAVTCIFDRNTLHRVDLKCRMTAEFEKGIVLGGSSPDKSNNNSKYFDETGLEDHHTICFSLKILQLVQSAISGVDSPTRALSRKKRNSGFFHTINDNEFQQETSYISSFDESFEKKRKSFEESFEKHERMGDIFMIFFWIIFSIVSIIICIALFRVCLSLCTNGCRSYPATFPLHYRVNRGSPLGCSVNPVGPPVNPVGYPVNPVGLPVNPVGYPVNPVGYPVNPVGYPVNPVVPPINPVGCTVNPEIKVMNKQDNVKPTSDLFQPN